MLRFFLRFGFFYPYCMKRKHKIMKKNKIDYLLPAHFATVVGVKPYQITRMREKLVTETFFGKWMVKLSPENLDLFPNRPCNPELDGIMNAGKGCGACSTCSCAKS